MYRSSRLVRLALIGTAAFGQLPPPDSVTQSLLAEVRLLRQDLQAVTVAAQRVQIVLYRLQIQNSAIARATQQHDEARSRLANAESGRNRMAAELKVAEDRLSATQDPNERKSLETTLPALKVRIEMLKAEELPLQAREIEALGQVRTEQAKLNELQTLLDSLDKALEAFARKP